MTWLRRRLEKVAKTDEQARDIDDLLDKRVRELEAASNDIFRTVQRLTTYREKGDNPGAC